MKVGDLVDGKYEVLRLLGEGGMGAVFEARHVKVGRRVALKVLHQDTSRQGELVERFLREAQAAAAVGSEHVVEVHDVGQLDDGAPYLVLEYLDGESLDALLKREGPLPTARASAIVTQVCEALEAVHARGIVHRDLKPANIFLVRRERLGEWVKLLDFGIAKVLPEITGRSWSLTRTGATMGTPYYMAPEQFRASKSVDARADLYSLGVIFYECLTGSLPFTADSYEELIISVATEEPRPPSLVNGSLGQALDAVVLRAMARSVGERYGTASELAEALRPFLAGQARDGMAPPVTLVVPAPAEAVEPGTSGPAAERGAAPALRTPSAWPVEPAPPVRRPSRAVRVGLALGGAVVLGLAFLAGLELIPDGRGGGGETLVVRRGPAAAVPTPLALTPPDPTPSSSTPMDPTPPDPTPRAPSPSGANNPWVAVSPAPAGLILGVGATAPASVSGFRPARQVAAPTYPFEILQHEVTWGELAPFLAEHRDVVSPSWTGSQRPGDERRPAVGVPWEVAQAFCLSLDPERDSTLPTEEEWEYAARGPARRPAPWGAQPLDLARTHAYRSAEVLSEVMTSPQDTTPGPASIYDLAGNALEWTQNLWREDRSGVDERWVSAGGRTYRAIRGLPPRGEAPAEVPTELAAARQVLCATGSCPDGAAEVLASVGFRCVRRER